jgi:hypothetical protein
MQPYFFPYIGYFQLIEYVDKWIVFDDVQYIRKGWVNRNRVLHPDIQKGWQYLTVPVRKHKKGTFISSIRINNDLRWKEELLGKLSHYKRSAPYYSQVEEMILECFSFESGALSQWLVNCLSIVCERLSIDFDYEIFSEMSQEIKPAEHAGQWALNIASSTGADVYVNPPGGWNIFDEDEFTQKGIDLKFINPEIVEYKQGRREFLPGLSILDVMLWNNEGEVKELLTSFTLCSMVEMRKINA